MGHLSNPIGLRLGLNRAWLVKGATVPFGQNIDLYNLLQVVCKYIFTRRRYLKIGIIYSHIAFRPFKLSIFLYDARFEVIYLELVRKLIKKLVHQPTFANTKFAKKILTPIRGKKLTFARIIIRKYLEKFRYPVFRMLSLKLRKIFLKYLPQTTTKNSDFTIKIHTIGNHSVTAKILGMFAIRKLRANNVLGRIIGPVIKGMRRYLKGLRIYCAGRFTRRQRASFRVFWFGKITLNKFSQPVDYYFTSIPLKFGVGSLKIWLTWNDKPKFET
jgi:hypothetical protein